MTVDHEVQRGLRPSHSKDLATHFDPKAIGTFTISQRKGGELIVIDGQHRRQAMLDRGLGETKVDCRVWAGLTEAEESDLFRKINHFKSPRRYDDFRQAVKAGDFESVEITQILEANGWHASDGSGHDGCVSAINQLQTVYRQNVNGNPPGQQLRDVVSIITTAWGHESSAMDGQIIAALGMLLAVYHESVDREALTKALAAFPGGPRALVGMGRGLKDASGGSTKRALVQVMVSRYNRKRSSGRLAPVL